MLRSEITMKVGATCAYLYWPKALFDNLKAPKSPKTFQCRDSENAEVCREKEWQKYFSSSLLT